jgi:PAS domain S-box-containing protein
MQHKNGSWLWIDATLCNLLDQPEVRGIVVNWWDVSKRKAAEDRLRLFQAVVLNAADGVMVTEARPLDAPGPRILYANPAFLKMTGYTPDEILGRTPRLLQGPRTDRATLNRVRQALEHYQSIQVELLNYCKDGREVWVELSIVPVADESGHFVYFVTIQRDITERKRAEQALRDSEERFRFLAHAVQDCISLTDPQRNTLYVNPACLQMTGYTEEEYCCLDFAQRAHPDDRQLLEQTYKATLHGETTTIQWRCQRKDGSYIWFETLSTPIVGADGQISKIVCCSRNITERRRQEEERRELETQIQQAQKWESISVLAGGIAHDFNNLLTSILGNASLALMDLPADSPVQRYLQQIEDSSNRAADLCRQMLAYAGKGQFVIEPVEISVLVEEMTNLLRAVISRKATLQLDLARHMPPVEGDATQLRQIVLNLITNASDALQDNPGTIRIATRCIRADQDLLRSTYINDDLPEGAYILIEVTDTGCGIMPDALGRIFDPFYTTKFTGRGLGLAAVLGIVRAHHGTLRVHSQPGAGSSFQILLPPMSQPATVTTVPNPTLPNWRGSGTVLVIEDEATIRDLALQILQSAGFQVLLAADGEEGLRRFTQNAGQLTAVLLDLTMPRMSGLETLREIRQQQAELPVILMSGYSEEEIRRKHGDLTFQAFLQKPFSRTTLLATLRQVLHSGSK